jgi:hypothetical protein
MPKYTRKAIARLGVDYLNLSIHVVVLTILYSRDSSLFWCHFLRSIIRSLVDDLS